MDLQIIVIKPPGKYLEDHPPEILATLVGCQFMVVPTSELIKYNRSDLKELLTADIRQIITLLSKAGKAKTVKYWKKYLAKHPSSNFLTFEVDEVKLIY